MDPLPPLPTPSPLPPLSQAERFVLVYLRDRGSATHSALTAELISAKLGDSLRLGAMMIGFRDQGWIVAGTDQRCQPTGEDELWEKISYRLTDCGRAIACTRPPPTGIDNGRAAPRSPLASILDAARATPTTPTTPDDPLPGREVGGVVGPGGAGVRLTAHQQEMAEFRRGLDELQRRIRQCKKDLEAYAEEAAVTQEHLRQDRALMRKMVADWRHQHQRNSRAS